MNISQVYIFIAIAVLVIVALFVFLIRRGGRKNKLSPLAGLACAFIIAGILFGDDRFIGYSLMGIGVILAIVDMFRSMGTKAGGA